MNIVALYGKASMVGEGPASVRTETQGYQARNKKKKNYHSVTISGTNFLAHFFPDWELNDIEVTASCG